jgi:hypothetical protein
MIFHQQNTKRWEPGDRDYRSWDNYPKQDPDPVITTVTSTQKKKKRQANGQARNRGY